MQIWGGQSRHLANHYFRRPPGYPLWTFWAIRDGGSSLLREGKRIDCLARRNFLLPPKHPYEVTHGLNNQPWLETYVLFDPPPDWIGLLDWPALPHGVRMLDLSADEAAWAEYDSALETLATTLLMPPETGFPYRKNAFERVLLLANLHNPAGGALKRDQRVRDVVRHIAENLNKPMDVQTLARLAHLSEVRFAQLFKQEIGLPVMQFVEAQRISQARELLVTTNLPIKQIASLTGFENPFHFSTRFKRRTGQTPRQYRLTPQAAK